jgi:Protein of unknown function (DUF2950)
MSRALAHLVLVLTGALLAAACTKPATQTSQSTGYATPDEALSAFVAAIEKDDKQELQRILGPGTEDLLTSGDEVADRAARESFLQRYREKHELVAGGPDDLVLQIGSDNWPLPIPLVRNEGRWHFDGAAGADELVLRRIGANELRTIDVIRGYVEAQEEYASTGHDGAAAGLFAQRLRSEPGKQNGLHWEVKEGEPPSPLGPFLAAAAEEGYAGTGGTKQPYHGYLYRTLLSQGPDANGGARDYLVDGKLEGGFALLAFPDTYGASGVMTFIVNHDGVVWQRDLGENTAQLASAMKQFNPDSGWTPLASEE